MPGLKRGLLVAAATMLISGTADAANPVSATYYKNWTESASGLTFSNAFYSETLPDINFVFDTAPPGHPSAADIFAADFVGSISAPSDGSYDFTFGSDDAGYLFIDGTLIGSLPGTHGYYTSVFSTTLTAGSHSLEVQYYNSACCNSRVSLALDPKVVFVPPTSGVPEPGTWALMILGFGAVGYALRRRRASVSFSHAYS